MRVHSRLTQRLSAIDAEADKPLPTEFRIFRKGSNPSDRGPDHPFIFDDIAAAAVMAEYTRAGNRLMMDLMHGATDEQAITLRADAADAMCWYDLEVRDGELWGVGVEWSTEGERRIRARLQRFVSPTFFTDETGRIVALDNVALVSRPGMFGATDLTAMRAKPRSYIRLAASFDAIRSALDGAIRGMYPGSDDSCCSCPYVRDVFAATVVYEYEGLLYQVGYSFAADKATIVGVPLQVETQYVPAAEAAKLRAKSYIMKAKRNGSR